MDHDISTIDFPAGIPEGYVQLDQEPKFDARLHLDLGEPEIVTGLAELGYSNTDIQACPSDFGVSTAFRILSDAGLAAMRDVCLKMFANRNSNLGTGINRLGSYVRGAGYRSQFIKDFCDSPQLAEHLSRMAGVQLARHSVPAVACGVNYAPEDITRAVDSWHTDSVAFDIVIMLSDPSQFEGGEFQYFRGTKHDGQALLGISGEEGATAELPKEKVVTVDFPAAGYGFLQQGNMIFHRACRLLAKAERMTIIPSFVVVPATANDGTNSVNMASWQDPGIVAELARHEAWRASAKLARLVDSIDVTHSKQQVRDDLNQAISSLLAFQHELGDPGNEH